jgi:tripartite-type tricarboxylate transporter receptor subunit TctC
MRPAAQHSQSQRLGFSHNGFCVIGLAALVIGASGHSRAQTAVFPAKPLRIIVGFPPGSSTDSIARASADHLRLKLGQPVVVDNRPGANGVLGATEAARAAADGYTLLATNSSGITVNPQIYRKITYQPDRDFTALTMSVSAPFILTINPASERTSAVNTVADLVALARAKSGQLTYGSAGTGNLGHLGFEMLNNRAGIRTVHVPYKGGSGAHLALLAREVDAHLATPSAVPTIRSGKLRALAVTSAKRWPDLPDVPTMIEAGFAGFDVPFWLGLMAPAQTPAPVIQTLYGTLATMRDDTNASRLLRVQGAVELMDPKSFAARIRAETATWSEVIKRENIQVD